METEKFFAKVGEKSTQYVYFRLENALSQNLIHITKGRMLELMRTERITTEPYYNSKESEVRLSVLIKQLISQGFHEQPVQALREADIKYDSMKKRKKVYIYDKAKWHYDGDYPKGVPLFQAYVHTGMFIAWAINNNLIANSILDIHSSSITLIRLGEMSGARFYETHLDGSFNENDLTDEGNCFAREYLNPSHNMYIQDYIHTLARQLPTEYHVEDSIMNYKQIERVIDERYKNFKEIQHMKNSQ